LALLLLLLFGTSLVLCGNLDSEEEQEDIEDAMKRTLTVESNDNKKFSLKSTRKSDDIHEELKLKFTVPGEFIQFECEWHNKSKDEAHAKVVVRLQSLVIYTPDSIPGLDNDTIVSQTDFKDMDWDDLVCLGTTDVSQYNCTLSSSDGFVVIRTFFTAVATEVEGQTLRPLSFKYSFTYKKNTTDSVGLITRLAVKSKDKDAVEVQDESTEEAEGVSTKSEKQVKMGSTGFFSWVDTFSIGTTDDLAVVHGQLSEDTAVESDESSKQIVFSFESELIGELLWDPKLGFDYSAGASALPLALLIVALLAVFL